MDGELMAGPASTLTHMILTMDKGKKLTDIKGEILAKIPDAQFFPGGRTDQMVKVPADTPKDILQYFRLKGLRR
jgi:hypothetical protein